MKSFAAVVVSQETPEPMTKAGLISFVRARALTLGAGISIAMLIGAIASHANATGYFGTIRFGGSEVRAGRSLGFGMNCGALAIAWTSEETISPGGIRYGFGKRTSRASDWEIHLPFWATVPLLCLLPMRFAWVYSRQLRRKLPGRCTQCGYDLRATPSRCPECGAESREQAGGSAKISEQS